MHRLLICGYMLTGIFACSTEVPVASINPETLTNTESNLTIKDPYAQLALETCDCMSPMIEKVNEAESLRQTHDAASERLQKSYQEIEDMRPQIEECNTIVKNRFAHILGKNQNSSLFLEALKNYCPSTYAVISKGISMKN
jgi:hypothetical protein